MNHLLMALQDPAVWVGIAVGLLISFLTRKKS